jgi:hypothetical protein
MKQMEIAAAAERACYRYRTPVLVGPWRRNPDKALEDAVRAGQARAVDGGDLNWLVTGDIEESRCDRPGPCGGVYPSE